MAESEDNGLDIEWGKDTCNICSEETWLTMVLYEPVGALPEEEAGNSPDSLQHPSREDEEAIALCGNCLGEMLKRLSELNDIDETEVSFDQMWKYLVYLEYPEYAKRVFPDDCTDFKPLSKG